MRAPAAVPKSTGGPSPACRYRAHADERLPLLAAKRICQGMLGLCVQPLKSLSGTGLSHGFVRARATQCQSPHGLRRSTPLRLSASKGAHVVPQAADRRCLLLSYEGCRLRYCFADLPTLGTGRGRPSEILWLVSDWVCAKPRHGGEFGRIQCYICPIPSTCSTV
jgi:hypothetical protein